MRITRDIYVSKEQFEKVEATAIAALTEVNQLRAMYRFLAKVTGISSLLSISANAILIWFIVHHPL